MQAGYIIGNWIVAKIKSWGANSAITWLAGLVGGAAATWLVQTGVQAGAMGIATYIGTHSAIGAVLAGPAAGVAAFVLGSL